MGEGSSSKEISGRDRRRRLMGSGAFFEGLAHLLDTLLKAVSQFGEIKDQSRRRDAARDLLAACVVVSEIVQNGEKLLKLAGSDPVGKITDMHEEERRPYAVEVHEMLREQLKRLVALSRLLEDAPVLQIVDANLKGELDAIIGTKEEGLMTIAAPLGFYLGMGAIPEQEEVVQYGDELASMRYQAKVLSLVLSGNESDASSHLDLDSASNNLNELRAAGERLRKHVTEFFSQEEIVLLAKDAEKRAHSF
jgi:hypothetical protein